MSEMFSYVAKQPILDANKVTIGYELLYRNGLTNAYPKEITAEAATATLITQQFIDNKISSLVGDRLCFINFPYPLFVHNIIDFLPVNQVVIEVLEDCVPNDTLFDLIKGLKAKGFRIALDDFNMSPDWERFLLFIDIIKFDFRAYPVPVIKNYIVKHTRFVNLSFLAEKIETPEDFQAAQEIGCTLYQGYFFSKPIIVKDRALSQNQMTVMQLFREVASIEINYDSVEKLLKQDLSLAYKLLRYANNVRYGSEPITSFRHAVVYMGKQELRRFVYLISATSLGNDAPSELYQMSLTRASFCEMLSKERKGHTDPDESFLCGLFSLLDTIMQKDMKEIMDEMPIASSIKDAILKNKGEMAFYLNFVKDYENLDFDTVSLRAKRLGITDARAIEMYQLSSEWAGKFMKS